MNIMKKIFSLLCCLTLLSSNASVFADTSLKYNYKETGHLLDETWYKGTCFNGKNTCEKYLIRYEDASKLVEDFTKRYKKFESDSLFQKIATTSVVSGAGLGTAFMMYHHPISTSLALISGASVCAVRNGVLVPIEITVSGILGAPIAAFNWVVKRLKLATYSQTQEDAGLMGDFMNFLCGYKNAKNKSIPHNFQTRFFGEKAVENEMAKPYKMVLDKLSDLIKKNQFENNNIIVVSVDTDPETLDGDIKFDSTTFFINYDKPAGDYFKKIKIK